ncbi:cysteine desulfurase [Sulfurimonas sp. MAG313]|nr:cysteine desulfurase [Sulfurimonas sp. MAG313]MDF1881866.1 cysteine desulfurase [Sulfurimonas sp. MAG313]
MNKQDFPFFNNTDIIYLDNAATTQKPQCVLDAMSEYYLNYCSNTHRGSHDLGNKATQSYEQARKTLADFFHVQDNEIIFTKGTTESINLLASSYVKKNFDTVILSELEHHSNILPWQLQDLQLEIIPLDKDLNIDLRVFEDILKEHPHSFVSITHISNAFGIVNPVKELIYIAHKYDCKILIDGAQALSHIDIDLKDLDADFYAVSAHKAYGPTGVGCLYGKYALLESMDPYQGGGSMIDNVSFEYSTFLAPPFRFEAGTQAIAEVIGFKEAINYLKSIKKEEEGLLSYAKKKLLELEDIILYTNATNVLGNISFNIKGIHHEDIGILLSKQNIMLRTGHHCALPIMKKLGINGTIRLSFAIYSTKQEIDKTIKAIAKAVRMLR